MYGTIWHALLAAGVIFVAVRKDEIFDLADDAFGMTAEFLEAINVKKRIKDYLGRGGSA